MKTSRPLALYLAPIGLLLGCAQSDGIDNDGAVYDGISPDTAIILIGTEPFWGLEVDALERGQHAARFTHPDDIEGSDFAVIRFAGNNGLGFSGERDGRVVQIALTPGECRDQMSERTYPFAATVKLGDETLLGCAYTSAAPFTGPQAP